MMSVRERHASALAELLAATPKYGDGVGLDRVAYALDRIGGQIEAGQSIETGEWLRALDAIKITGTNGKGSVAALLAATFSELGISTGLFTSPHLRRVTERVLVDGVEVEASELLEAWHFVADLAARWHAEHGERFGAFELLTAAALRCFRRHRVEIVIAEAGIGGRFDATRAIPGRFAALTSLDLEHTELLGSSLGEIAADKADLCPDGGILVVGASLDAETLEQIRSLTRDRQIELIAVDAHSRLLDCDFQGRRMIFDMELCGPFRSRRIEGVDMAMMGRHQWSNAAVALFLAEAWTRRHRRSEQQDELIAAWRRALVKTSLAGRFKQTASAPEVFVDFCHTPRAAAAVAALAREALDGHKILLVLGISVGKDIGAVARPLLEIADAAIFTRARHRGSDPTELEKISIEQQPTLRHWRHETIEEAVAHAREQATTHSMTILVAGGIFLGVEAMETLAGRDPSRLHFF